MNKPESLVILGTTYKIVYCDKPSDVDVYKRESLWGQVDFWTRTIRIYDNGRNITDIWRCIFHEVLHIFGEQLKLDILDKGTGGDERKHDELDIVATALVDTLFRNGLMKTNEEETPFERILGKIDDTPALTKEEVAELLNRANEI